MMLAYVNGSLVVCVIRAGKNCMQIGMMSNEAAYDLRGNYAYPSPSV
jgi:hypothetical protein